MSGSITMCEPQACDRLNAPIARLRGAFAVLAAVLLLTPAASNATAEGTLENQIHDSLLALKARQHQLELQSVRELLATRNNDIFQHRPDPVVGNSDGNITVAVFFDYYSPDSRKVASTIAQATVLDPQLRIVYKEVPILGRGSKFAAKAALAANRQDRYREFQRAVLEAGVELNDAVVLDAAASVGLDIARLKTDMNSAAIQTTIEQDTELATALHIDGTPGFVIGDQILRGAIGGETMAEAIRRARTGNSHE